ncbi:hypothetical protein VTK56DRAFT_5224 [Thermocarpiscus australiensis]
MEGAFKATLCGYTAAAVHAPFGLSKAVSPALDPGYLLGKVREGDVAQQNNGFYPFQRTFRHNGRGAARQRGRSSFKHSNARRCTMPGLSRSAWVVLSRQNASPKPRTHINNCGTPQRRRAYRARPGRPQNSLTY